MIGFGDAITRYFKNYFNFYGRASRAEYWWPFLMRTLVYLVLIAAFIGSDVNETNFSSADFTGLQGVIIIVGSLFYMINIIPKLAVAARRFHDLGQTGWLVLVFVIVNFLITLTWFAQMIWFAMPGMQGHNIYGSDPYGSEADIFG